MSDDEKYGGVYPYRAAKTDEVLSDEDEIICEDVYGGPEYFNGAEEEPDEPDETVRELPDDETITAAVYYGPEYFETENGSRPPISRVYAGPDIIRHIDRTLPHPARIDRKKMMEALQKRYCPQCAAPQSPENVYCPKCGTKLPADE